MPSHLIVLLGNPGQEYADTRHNIAWWVSDVLATRRRIRFQPDGDSSIAEGRFGGKAACLQKPLTYMNDSGREVSRLFAQFKLTPSELVLISDDIDLAVGTIRIRARGSSGGHRGLDSIFQEIGTEMVTRCRCGVGPVPSGTDAADFVLDHFGPEELIAAHQMASVAADAVEMILARGVAAAANRYNRKPSVSDAANGKSDTQRPGED